MATRRATYERRCQSLMKKASELAALPGAEVCVVVYDSEDAGAAAAQPEVWPSAEEAARLFRKLKAMPEGRFKKTMSQLQFLQNRVSKVREQVKKSAVVNGELESSALLHECVAGRRPGLVGVTEKELAGLMDLVEAKMSKVRARLQQLGVGEGAHPRAAPPMENGGELGAVFCSAFEGGDGAGPSGSGCEAIEASNQGCDLGSPWAQE
ncbi:hypothetical protein SETIT_8G182900v2 [Setaria italica]|uniref:MADS-box domain-containing protein n=2 Tax=Setaria italica TaxID=4555 RepID=A0A368S958_SETIT|nr:agamous-like MADS-box protein AGL80 [Setaria italica]RCV38938.1 hypothetical protein SETIT_8G182900v2 [Setaria italica]